MAADTKEVRITSDRLFSDNNTRIIKFSGNVRAVRGDTVITSERLLIYPEADIDALSNERSFKDTIKKVVAEGNVVIRRGDFKAVAQQAVYSTEHRTIELSGKNTEVIRGNNRLTGAKMVLHLEKERIRVTGIDERRVKAVFETR